MFTCFRKLKALALLAFTCSALAQNPAVLTAEYDNARTTANNSEYRLNPTNVGSATFGKLGEWPVDGVVAAQPLYVPSLPIGRKIHNVVFVATMNNSVYAFDADSASPVVLWHTQLGPNVPLGYAGSCPAAFSTGALGILSTPVIDLEAGKLYVVAANPVAGQKLYTHMLYALNLANGNPDRKSPVVLSGSAPGTGTTSVNGTVSMGPTTANLIQRPALLLQNDRLYIGFSGCGPDPSPYHGWVLTFNANTFKQITTFNATPNGDEGGVWQAGRGLVGDTLGSVYFETGNGSYDKGDFGESFLKLTPRGTLQDWYTPPDVQTLSDLDLDLSTTSPIYAPDSHLLIGGGKAGLIYVLNAASLGHSGPAVQTFTTGTPCNPSFNSCKKIQSMVYWQSSDGSRLYTWPTNDRLYSYRFSNGQFTTSPESFSGASAPYPGGLLTVSSAGGLASTGIVWAITPGVLHAFMATDLSQELWNSSQNASRDGFAGAGYHFEQITVVGGKVYAPAGGNKVLVYGLK